MTLKILLSLAILIIVLAAAQWFLASFRSQSPEDYATAGPAFDPRIHLAGEMVSEGVIYGPTGRVQSRFVADMLGVWDNKGGTLSEVFSFGDKYEPLQREWKITDTGPDSFTATAPDIVGEAQGTYVGAALQMRYRLRLAESAGGHVLDVIDWLYLVPNGHIINKSEMRKFGIKVAELVATIRPAHDIAQAAE